MLDQLDELDDGSDEVIKELKMGVLMVFYVVRGDKAQWPYESVLLPEAERRRIAKDLGVTEEVKRALLVTGLPRSPTSLT
mgnify:CR=1 FL=1